MAGAAAVTNNSGGTNVTNNNILGYLQVTGNTGTVVDHPNTVYGSTNLQ